MDFNGDFKYDLALGQLGEGWIGKMLSNNTIEVKFDFACHKTGNFYIEYQSRGKPSGISTSQADYWMLIASTEKGLRLKDGLTDVEKSDVMFAVLLDTERLKEICKTNFYRKNVKGGDNNTSIGLLIKSKELLCQLKKK
tara:strand:+ start:140 stop:556 length:417 start_codon:yes stop_codon:yes gene_type:complete